MHHLRKLTVLECSLDFSLQIVFLCIDWKLGTTAGQFNIGCWMTLYKMSDFFVSEILDGHHCRTKF
jgi:hypothetical protein